MKSQSRGSERKEREREKREKARESLRDRKKKEENTRTGIPVVKSVRRNAELTSFASYTSAVAHIINITEKGYSSSFRQRMGERRGMQRGRRGRTGRRGATVLPVTCLDSTDGACGV